MRPADTIAMFGWDQVAAILTIATLTTGGIIFVLRWKLASFFVTKVDHATLMKQIASDHDGLSTRLKNVEREVQASASTQDVQALAHRVGAIETAVAGASEKISAVADGVRRVEHIMGLLLQHQLDQSK